MANYTPYSAHRVVRERKAGLSGSNQSLCCVRLRISSDIFSTAHLFRFISDIAAFEMKIPFLIGGIVTALFFILTIASVHYARCSSRTHRIKDSWPTKIVSLVAEISGAVAGVCLVLLSIMDSYRISSFSTAYLAAWDSVR